MTAPRSCSRRALVPGLLTSLLMGAWLALPAPCGAGLAEDVPSLFDSYPSWCDEAHLDRALERGADINETRDGVTVLDMVLARGDAEDAAATARLLLHRGATVGTGERGQALALTRLVLTGATAEELGAALEQAGPGSGAERLPNGFTPFLWAAAMAPTYRHLRAFLTNGADVGQRLPARPATGPEGGENALAIAAMVNPSPDVTRGLAQELPLDEHFEFLQDRTPLMLACAANPSLAVAERLVDLGASVEASDTGLNTPFLLAARREGASRLLRTLSRLGADTRVQNADEETALIAAARVNGDTDVIRTLLDLKVPRDPLDVTGDNALTAAVRGNPNPEVIRLLLKADLALVPDLGTGAPVWQVLPPARAAWLSANGLLGVLKKKSGGTATATARSAIAPSGAGVVRGRVIDPARWDLSRPDALWPCHTPRSCPVQ